MIIMKEQASATYQYRVFKSLEAVAKFLKISTGVPRTKPQYFGTEIVEGSSRAITPEDLKNWTGVNVGPSTTYFDLIDSDNFQEVIPLDIVKTMTNGISDTFGKTQEFTPEKHLMPH